MKYKCKKFNCKTPFTIQMCLKIVKVQTFNIAYPCISLGSVHTVLIFNSPQTMTHGVTGRLSTWTSFARHVSST